LWKELVDLEERLEGFTEALKSSRSKELKNYHLKNIEQINKRINEINEELDGLGDNKYN
jgi:hypothetical protein